MLMLNGHRFLQCFPALTMLNNCLVSHNSPAQQIPHCAQHTWRRFSSNQTQASLQLTVQRRWFLSLKVRLASENIDCAPLKLESCPFVSVLLSKAAQYTKDLGRVPEHSHMLWFLAWLNLIKANTTGTLFYHRGENSFSFEGLVYNIKSVRGDVWCKQWQRGKQNTSRRPSTVRHKFEKQISQSVKDWTWRSTFGIRPCPRHPHSD